MPKGGGILAIRSKSTGRSYFVGVADLRQRGYDAHRALQAGRHHNAALQHAWTANPCDFEIVVVEEVRCMELLGMFKAIWIERHDDCFNMRSGVRRSSQRERRPRIPTSTACVPTTDRCDQGSRRFSAFADILKADPIQPPPAFTTPRPRRTHVTRPAMRTGRAARSCTGFRPTTRQSRATRIPQDVN